MRGYATLGEALARGRGREIPFCCPVHDDRNASASVNPVKGVWVCYACGAKGSTEGALDDDEDRFARDIEELLGAGEPRIYSERWLDQFDAGPPHPYWRSRFSEQACRHFRLGYDHDRGTPTYPIRDNTGNVLGVVRRSLLDTGPKYLYPRGANKSALLYGFHSVHWETQQVATLVEGAPDVWAAWEAGIVAFGIYGALLHDAQIRLLHRLDTQTVVLALDNDDAGRRAIHGWLSKDGDAIPGARARLEAEGFSVVVPDWDTHAPASKDLADCDLATRRTLLDFH